MYKKNKLLYLTIVVIIGLVFVILMNKKNREDLVHAPKIRKEFGLKNINVKKISFERNGLFLNNKQYNSGGISWYSEFHFRDSIVLFEDISTPFTLKKRKNNDTLKLIKDDIEFYLLISKELRYDKLN
ncbi:hypothetical protein [Flavobacterium litorale]|uniref:Uncharacterized protein n=1 Tax=Flavobacterium litorale TaxID=2856519 RepID=A0ABX8VAP3_9FLAO|nr:hypothetical protein [Flavobacterium litorale]QYJ68278.1 hypothetical protein K1I41_12250 [Flavobacterium litorale]